MQCDGMWMPWIRDLRPLVSTSLIIDSRKPQSVELVSEPFDGERSCGGAEVASPVLDRTIHRSGKVADCVDVDAVPGGMPVTESTFCDFKIEFSSV